MGLRLPIYPYYAGRGRGNSRTSEASEYNRRTRSSLQNFQDYFSRTDVKQYASGIIIRGSMNPDKDNWFCPAVFDHGQDVSVNGNDDDKIPVLFDLLDRVGQDGTILIPDQTHIVGQKNDRLPIEDLRKLVEKVDKNNIEILPLVLNLKHVSYDLRENLNSTEVNSHFIHQIPRVAMEMTEYLKRAAKGGEDPSSRKSGTNRTVIHV